MNPAPSQNLGFLLADAARLLRRRFEQESRDIPMTAAQLRILVWLARNEGVGQAALASMLDLEPMTLCRHVDRMEAAGLVERRQDPDDRRARQIFTTEKGRMLLHPMRERAALILEQVQSGLSPETRAALHRGLETIVGNLSRTEAGAAERHRRNREGRGDAA